jgi:two-component system nitrate/nitrite response regulator NarL
VSQVPPAWPVRIRLARDPGRLAIVVAIRFVIGEFGVVTGSQAGGTVGLVLFVVGGFVVLYTAALALYLVTVAAEVVPEELHIVWPIRRTRYRLRPGAVTRLRTIRRRGLFKAELGGFGIEFGQGTSEDGEQLTVIRLDPRVPLNLVPTEHARLAMMLVDIDLPGMSGVHLVREIAPRLPDCKIVMLTGSTRSDDLIAAVRGGAFGYLTKDMAPDALVRALFGIRDGDLPMPRRLAAQLVKQLLKPASSASSGGLSERELQVLGLVADGLTDRDIGRALGISPRTVGRHVGSILAKLGARNRSEAARRFRDGL